MRRTDKAVTERHQVDAILCDSLVCRLAFAHNNEPYLVPLSFGYDGAALYFHTAPEGRKIACFLAGGPVCFECERNVAVQRDPQDACRWSMAYESVIGYGVISELTALDEKEHALNEIMRHYSGKPWPFTAANLARVRLWKLTISSLTGKQSKPKTT